MVIVWDGVALVSVVIQKMVPKPTYAGVQKRRVVTSMEVRWDECPSGVVARPTGVVAPRRQEIDASWDI